jgi:serine/threonine protein phosphatase PrpC
MESAATEQKWVALSKKGYVPYNRKKMNQDAYFVAENFVHGVSLYLVCDGHGEFGHHVSSFVKNNIVRCFIAQSELKSSPLEYAPKAIEALCGELTQAPINVAFSGTTAVFALHVSGELIVGNIGDSRCIILSRTGDDHEEFVATPLSRDQKPDDPDEKERILSAGGRVEPLPGPPNEDMGPCRVWLAEIDVPGLAMSRSIGDEISHTVGVSSIPEMKVHVITSSDKYMVMASDGVWEFLSNQQVGHIVARFHPDMEKAAAEVVAESTRRWQEVEEVIDDITVIILSL